MEKTLREKISDVAKKAGKDIIDAHKSMDEKDLARIIEKSIFVSIGEFTIELGKEKPSKSKFMEEISMIPSLTAVDDTQRFIDTLEKYIQLIDKHKKDK